MYNFSIAMGQMINTYLMINPLFSGRIMWLGLSVRTVFSKCFFSVSFCPIELIVPYLGEIILLHGFLIRALSLMTSSKLAFQMAISLQRIVRSTSCLILVGFSGTADRMDLLPVSPNPRWRSLMTSSRNNRCRNFGAKYLGNETR